MSRALVLNVTYEPLSVVAGRRAAVLVLADKADLVHESGHRAALRAARHRGAVGHPAPPARAGALRPARPAQPAGGVRARPARVPVLLGARRDPRPRRPPQPGRAAQLGERRGRLPPVQPAQGRPVARAHPHGAAPAARPWPAATPGSSPRWAPSRRPGSRTSRPREAALGRAAPGPAGPPQPVGGRSRHHRPPDGGAGPGHAPGRHRGLGRMRRARAADVLERDDGRCVGAPARRARPRRARRSGGGDRRATRWRPPRWPTRASTPSCGCRVRPLAGRARRDTDLGGGDAGAGHRPVRRRPARTGRRRAGRREAQDRARVGPRAAPGGARRLPRPVAGRRCERRLRGRRPPRPGGARRPRPRLPRAAPPGSDRARPTRLARCRHPVVLDEPIGDVDTVRAAIALGGLGGLNLKPGKGGGLRATAPSHRGRGRRGDRRVRRRHARDRASVAPAPWPSRRSTRCTWPTDLGPSDWYFPADLTEPIVAGDDGRLAVPRGPGIGVVPDAGRLDAATVDRLVLGRMTSGWRLERAVGPAADFHGRALPSGTERTVAVLTVERPALVLGSTQRDDVVDRAALAAAGCRPRAAAQRGRGGAGRARRARSGSTSTSLWAIPSGPTTSAARSAGSVGPGPPRSPTSACRARCTTVGCARRRGPGSSASPGSGPAR